MKDFNLNSLKIFLVVASSNSFLEASNKLYISQPAISKSINKLEEDLGVTLFYRANKGITLTPDGEKLLKYVKDSRMLLLSTLKNLSVNNNIVIGVPSFIVHSLLIDKINDFKKKNNNINFKIIDLNGSELIESLERHEVDFILDIEPINVEYGNLIIESICEIDTCFIKSKDNKKNYKKLIDLDNEDVIVNRSDSKIIESLIKYIDGRINIVNRIEYDNDSLITLSVKKNMGVGYTVKSELLNSKDIEIIDIETPKVIVDLIYIDNELSIPSKEFIETEFGKEVKHE